MIFLLLKSIDKLSKIHKVTEDNSKYFRRYKAESREREDEEEERRGV